MPLVAGALTAQGFRWDPLRAGYLHDAMARSIRSIQGLPGGATIGAAVLADVDMAWLAPAGKWGVATRQGRTLVFQLENAGATEMEVSEALDGVDSAAWSADGSKAVLYSAASRRLQLVRFAGSGPGFGGPIETGFLEGAVSSLAVSGSGKIALAVREGASHGVYVVDQETTPVLLSALEDPRFLAFSSGGDTLYVAEATGDSLLEFAGLAPGAARRLALELPDPIGIALSADGRSLYAGSGSGRKLYRYDIAADRITAETGLEQQPAVLERLPGGALFLLNRPQRQNGPVIVLDTMNDPAVYFIPALD
jgi:sugar lactone lactonase YvrE